MDINELRTIITCLSFIVFAGIVFWAYSSKNKARFDEAAELPFTEPGDYSSNATPENELDSKKTGGSDNG